MKLKINKYIIVALFSLVLISVNAQTKSLKLTGIVKYDSTYLQNINILNGTGVVQNPKEVFTINHLKGYLET